MNTIRSIVSMNQIPPRLKLVLSRFGSLILLFQRTPVVQFFFPEAGMLGGAGMANSFSLAVTTVVGLGAYDSVAGATTIVQNSPINNNTIKDVPVAVNTNLIFDFECLTPKSAPKSWSTAVALPSYFTLTHTNSVPAGVYTNSIKGTPTVAGTTSVTVKVWEDPYLGGESYSQIFKICVLGFSLQPTASQTIASGSPASLSCSVTGVPTGVTPTYQWYLGTSGTGTLITGATSSSYAPTPSATTNYWVKVTSVLSTSTVSVNSNTAVVNIADTTKPTVTINQKTVAPAQPDPTSGTTINYTVVFSESVANFATGDVTISGTAGGTKIATVTGSGTTYNVAVTGMTTAGTVIASLAGGVANDAAGNASSASTSTDATVTFNIDPFADWASVLPANQQGPEQIPQNDGVTNLMKYACNLNPLAPDVSKLTVGGSETKGLPVQSIVGGKLRMEFLRRKASANPGVTYIMQFSPDLGAASWSAVDVSTTPAGTSINSEWERVTVDDTVGGSTRFGRLKVTQP